MAALFDGQNDGVFRSEAVVRDPHHRTFAIVSLSVSLASLIATVISFYWFVKMRRSFRHDLIMLLIQSDFMKSLWFTVYPIVSLTRKDRISSSSAFCQISGFFLALGIESSDVAVLLIAIHSALYFVYPRGSGGGRGLYPYRHVAYAFYAVVPLLMASLAFIRGVPGYVDSGEYCYLPSRPRWYRMALSWIPRYVNFIILIIIYSCIYVYVRILMRRYSRRSSSAMVTTAEGDAGQQPQTVPRSYTLNRHGLIPKSTPALNPKPKAVSRTNRSTCASSKLPRSVFTRRGSAPVGPNATDDNDDKVIPWRMPNFQQKSPSRRHDHDTKNSGIPPDGPHQDSPQIQPLIPAYLHAALPASCEESSLRNGLAPSRHHHHHHQRNSTEQHERGLCPCQLLSIADEAMLDPEGIVRNRDKIRRQLRLLFLYPLVYALIWVAPFVSDVMRYRDTESGRGPFGLRLAFLISLAIQGLADSIVFAFRERPWRYARAGGGFWASVWSRIRLSVNVGRRRSPGRTRDEMFDEARIARLRRDGEAHHERVVRRTTGGASLRTTTGRQNWWDGELRDASDWSDHHEEEEDETGMVDWGNGLKGSGIPVAEERA